MVQYMDYLCGVLQTERFFTQHEVLFILEHYRKTGLHPEIPADYATKTPEMLRQLDREGCIEWMGNEWHWRKPRTEKGAQGSLFD